MAIHSQANVPSMPTSSAPTDAYAQRKPSKGDAGRVGADLYGNGASSLEFMHDLVLKTQCRCPRPGITGVHDQQ